MTIGPNTAIDILEDNGVDVASTCTLGCYAASNKDGIEAGDCPSLADLVALLSARPVGEQVSLWSGYFARVSARQ